MSYFDEQPDGDPHGECAAEIHSLEAQLLAAQVENKRLRESLQMSYDSMTKSAGWTRELMGNKADFSDFLDGVERRNNETIQMAKAALATHPDPSLLSQHDEQVKREGVREALKQVADDLMITGHATAATIPRRMIAALDQPIQKETL